MGENEISRRRLLRAMGKGAAGLAGAQLAGGMLGSPAGANPLNGGPTEPREFRTRLTERYGMKYPIVQAGFSAFYTTPELVAAVSNAGGLGCLGAVPEAPVGVRAMIRATKKLTNRPFGMDYVYFPYTGKTVHSPGYENADDEHRTREINWTCTDEHIDVCVEEGVPFLVFFWTPPEKRWVKKLQAAGIELWAQVGSVRGAKEAVDWGAKVIVAQGMQAGGHNRGYMDGEPLLRQELVPRVKDALPKDIIVVGAGGVADGRTLAACLREGAEAAWSGTVYAASKESYAHEEYKRRVVAVENGWNETRENMLFGPEWPYGYTRAIMNRVMKEWQGKEDLIPTPPPPPASIGTHRLAPFSVPGGIPYSMPKFSLAIPTRDVEGDLEEMCLLAGAESAPLVKTVESAKDITVQMGESARAILLGQA
ncbi:MAG TPA: nitronate monooxygenase [Acidimicrobiia bacterium]|jgi:enoyl-[acyl-carrier protein] reductase II|nr:nitronate monooxygenase [Acidimicrobiia bacterium]